MSKSNIRLESCIVSSYANTIGNECFCTKRYFFGKSFRNSWTDNILHFADNNACKGDNCKIFKIVVDLDVEGFDFSKRTKPVSKIIVNNCIIKNIIDPKCVERIIFRGFKETFDEFKSIHSSLELEFENYENYSLCDEFEFYGS